MDEEWMLAAGAICEGKPQADSQMERSQPTSWEGSWLWTSLPWGNNMREAGRSEIDHGELQC
jgi:hypothetical protein